MTSPERKELLESHQVSLLIREGRGCPVLFLHGLGSTSDDWDQVMNSAYTRGRAFARFDYPGAGRTPYPAIGVMGVDDLAELVVGAASHLGNKGLHLVGHSLGGLVVLIAATRLAGRVRSLISIEGNLAPEDCEVFSRAATAHSLDQLEEAFFPVLRWAFGTSKCPGDSVFAQRFHTNTTPRAFLDYCHSIVRVCDDRPLLDTFLSLPIPRMYIRGTLSPSPSYLSKLIASPVEVVSIPESGHFPLYANPNFVAKVCAEFFDRAESVSTDPAVSRDWQ